MIKLTKKQTEQLRSDKCQVVPPANVPLLYHVHMSLTQGELLAFKHALEAYESPVGADVRAYLLNALEVAQVDL